MTIVSLRMQRRTEALMGELDEVLGRWGEGIDRHVPLTSHAVTSINTLIGEVRRVVSRASGTGQLLPLAGHEPVMPADAVLRLLVARHLLGIFVLDHADIAADGAIEWHEGEAKD